MMTDLDDYLLRPGDRLFSTQGHWTTTMAVDPAEATFRDLIFGYKKAADILVAQLPLDYSIGSMTLAYPIIFLYRHHIELCLKETIRRGNILHKGNSDFRKVHKLVELWKVSRSLIEATWPGGSTDTLDAIEACLTEFAAVDPSSTAFRYPGAAPASGPPLNVVNFSHLSEQVAKLSELLDGAACLMDEYFQDKARSEYEAEAHAFEAEVCAEYEADAKAEYEAAFRDYYGS